MDTVSVRPSVCLSNLSTAAATCGRFAAVGPANRRYRLIAALPALRSNYEQCYVVSWCGKLNADLLTMLLFVPSVLRRCCLGDRKGIRPVKNWVVGCWRGYLSGARCRLAYGLADATATHCLLTGLVLPFWYRLAWVIPEKGRYTCVCVCVLLFVNLRWLNLLTHPNVHRVDYMAELNNRESVCNVAAVNHCER